jgi:hypothetical protein
VLNASWVLAYLNLTTTLWVGNTNILIMEAKKLVQREVKHLAK